MFGILKPRVILTREAAVVILRREAPKGSLSIQGSFNCLEGKRSFHSLRSLRMTCATQRSVHSLRSFRMTSVARFNTPIQAS